MKPTRTTSALLEITKRHVAIRDVDVVDPNGSSSELVDRLQRTVYVFAKDGSGEAVEGVVGLVDHVFLIFKLAYDAARTDRLPNNLHIWPGLREKRGLRKDEFQHYKTSQRWEHLDE